MSLASIGELEAILKELVERYPVLACCSEAIKETEIVLEKCFRQGGKLLVCGNGGSAADSEHIVGELMKNFKLKRAVSAEFLEAYRVANHENAPNWLEGALPAISLVSQTALGTAFGNDEAAVGVFAQQVYGYGRPDDVLFAISTSGRSSNVIEAAKVARAKGMRVLALTGRDKSPLSMLAHVAVLVPETQTAKIQELHLPIYHALCASVEAALFKGERF